MEKIKVAFVADMLLENVDGAIRTMYQLINRIKFGLQDHFLTYYTATHQPDLFDGDSFFGGKQDETSIAAIPTGCHSYFDSFPIGALCLELWQ